VRFFRDVANVMMDANDLERVTFNALGGAHDYRREPRRNGRAAVDLNLAGATGTGDAAADSVLVVGTNGADDVVVTGDATSVLVRRLRAAVSITGVEAATDRLAITTREGNDTVNASRLAAAMALNLDGGPGDDALAGGPVTTPWSAATARTRSTARGDDNSVYQGTARHDDIRVSRRNTPAGPQVIFQNRREVNASLFLNAEAITVLGGSGNDIIVMDRSAGVLWRANFFGGSGNDRLIGSALDDTLDGGTGYNVLQGNGGTDVFRNGLIAPSAAVMATLRSRATGV
jgi:Ca2+-binding RTX toxin-like protein